MKNTLLFVAFISFLLGCKPKEVDPAAPTTTPRGAWTAELTAGGFNKFESFRNFQYNFEVTGANQPVTIRAVSPDIKIQFALFNPNGTQIGTAGADRDISRDYTLNAGKYRVVVAADREAVGAFDLSVSGLTVTRIPSQTLRSDTQNWGVLGGGGNVKSFKNHFYTFDVTEDNFSPDIDLQSADTDVLLDLYDPLGTLIDYNNSRSRSQYLLRLTKKGTYTVMVSTLDRGSVGSYKLIVVGKVENLKRVESQSAALTGRWPDNKATDTYSIQLMPNTSPLDIEMASPDTQAFMDLQTNTGSFIANAGFASKTQVLVQQNMAKNTYRIQVYPLRISGGPGNYTLTIHGQFTDFKKI